MLLHLRITVPEACSADLRGPGALVVLEVGWRRMPGARPVALRGRTVGQET